MAMTLEERVSKMESELADLRTEVRQRAQKPGWISQITGSRRNDPVYQEILRLGKEIRDAEEPPEDLES